MYILQICVGGLFLIELALVGLVSELAIRLEHTYYVRTGFVGGFGYFFGALLIMPRFSPVVRISGLSKLVGVVHSHTGFKRELC